MIMVVAYDITDDRRRNKVAAELSAIGWRVQRSVFECVIDADELSDVQQRVASLIDTETDVVHIYRQCGSCYAARTGVEREAPPVHHSHFVV